VRPPGEAWPDWSVTRDVAVAMGTSWHFAEPADVMDEIALVAPHMFGGVRYDRLGPYGLQWRCPEPSHPGTATIHTEAFVRGRCHLVAINYAASPERCSEDYPFMLVTDRVLEH